MAIDPVFKARWVAALRSGQFQQTDSTLKDRDGYCCLGVLCHVLSDVVSAAATTYREDGVEIEIGYDRETADEWGFTDEIETTELPPPVLAALKLELDEQSDLIVMNDAGKSFAEIADYIEANL